MSVDRRQWVLLAYRMPREPSTPRIAVWRKLRRLGVAQIGDGLVAVPHSAGNLEQMGWVANDVLDAGGEALLWEAELTSAKQERELVARLNHDVAAAYRAFVDATEAARATDAVSRRQLDGFQRELRDIVRRDHLGATGRDRAERAFQRLSPRRGGGVVRWVTRSGCHVDRAACAWLIVHNIDADATFSFTDDDEIPEDATAFDVVGVALSHHGDDCTFETMLRVYGLEDPVLWDVARIVHEADLADDRYVAPEAAGLDVVCRGLTFTLPDREILAVTNPLFDGLYEYRRRALLLGRDPA